MASKLWRAGLAPELVEPDIRCQLAGRGVYVACKRPFSARGARQAYTDALGQIETALQTAPSGARGTVALSITRFKGIPARCAVSGKQQFRRHRREAFVQRLRELGWSAGNNVMFEARYAEGKVDRLPGLAAELAQLKVSVILAFGTPASLAVKHATATIPVVVMAGDPVGTGLVTSLARPGGNITGLTPEASVDLIQMATKRLGLLKEAAPKTLRVGILWNTANPAEAHVRNAVLGSARALGLTLLPVEVQSTDDFSRALTLLRREHADALTATEDLLIVEQRQLIVDFALQNRLPTVFGGRVFVDAGGLMSYGTDWVDLLRRLATFVDKILRGAKPADLPVEQPTKFELVMNLKWS